ncbi:RecT family recombinase [Lysinibacillus capsici]|uniref:RecT family recombinase n=1 Tax=Lysinibacillus capsici TaxID=2115968 RepID=UPI00289B5F44|nr:RecT family recombinase [Lysinibacillus capsici]
MTNQVAQQQNQVAQKEKQNAFVTKVADKIAEMKQQGQINLPDNYSAVNALQAAYFTLTAVDFGSKQALIDKVTPESVAFALQDMAIQGLSVAKKQGYFVPYGDKLQFIRSYHGTQAVLKRLHGVKDIWANVIWKGEEFEVEYNERGQLAFKGHKVNWKAATGKKEDIEGAYCIIEREDGTQFLTVMTMDEILTAWSTAKTQNVQNKYPQEMAKRTVINRASKAFINTSDDSDLLIDAVNRSTENEFEPTVKDMGDIEEVKREIEQNANTEEIDIQEPPTPVQDADYVEVPQQEQQQASFADGPGF